MITNLFCIAIFASSYFAFQKPALTSRYLHHPYREMHLKQWERLLTSGFLHGSWNHLLINLFVLWQFGQFVENYFLVRFGETMGSFSYIFFLLSAIVVSNIGTLIKHRDNPGFRSLGASGVTSSMVLVYVLFNPWQMFIFPPVPAIVFAILYLGYSTWAAERNRDHIDHYGHLWGSLYGIVFIAITDPAVFRYFLDSLSDLPW